MRWQILLLLSLLAWWAPAAAKKDGEVWELTPKNFDTKTSHGDWLISFTAPWCSHCQHMKPHFKDAAKQLKGKVNFANVDATKFRSLSTRFGVNGFPTFYFIRANGSEVRQASVSYSAESFRFYAEKGWTKDAPLAQWSSPNGPVGKAKFYALLLVDKLIALQDPLIAMTGLPGPVIGFSIMLVGVAASTAALLGCAVWLGPTKRRAQVARGRGGQRDAATTVQPANTAPAADARPHAE